MMRIIFLFLWGYLITGCVNTGNIAYRPLELAPEKAENTSIAENTVWHELKETYYKTLPNCVMIVPSNEPHFAKIEQALARHAFLIFDKVISAAKIETLARKQGFNLDKKQDIQRLAKGQYCSSLLYWQGWGSQDVDIIFWTQRRIGLTLRLETPDGILLWHAKHIAKRSDGGLPSSPFNALTSLVMAAQLREDQDITPSMVDDAVRRMIITLPTLKL